MAGFISDKLKQAVKDEALYRPEGLIGGEWTSKSSTG